jgi:putative ABC transport system permease protein
MKNLSSSICHFSSLTARFVIRDALRHPLLSLINILSVALGVAVFLAIQITNYSANRSLAAGVDVVAGKANLEVRGDLDDALFPSLQKVPGCFAATPVLEKIATLPDFRGEYLHLVGVDPLTNVDFRTFEIKESSGANFDQWFSNPSSVAVTRAFAEAHHLERGSKIRVRVGEEIKTLSVEFLFDAKEADSRLAAMDIGWLQELSGETGKLSSVLFRLSDPLHPAAVISKLKELLPASATVDAPQSRSSQIEKMVAGFQLNLTALSLASLMVGVFLIYNTVAASVVRRRAEIGILRSLGVPRGQIRLLFLGEASFYSLCGVALGIILGLAIAPWCIGFVAKTISNLYVLTSIERSFIPWDQVVVVTAFGLATGWIGAWIPANQAAGLPPLRALNLGFLIEKSQRFRPGTLVISGSALLLAVVTGWLAMLQPAAGFVSAMLVLLSFSFLSPSVTYALGWATSTCSSGFYLTRIAGQNLIKSLYRNSITSAALGSAIALCISVSVMIFSFRLTVDRWMDRRLIADIFVTPADNQIAGFQSYVAPSLIQFLRTLPEVESVATYRELNVALIRPAVPQSPRPPDQSESAKDPVKEVTLGVTAESPRNMPEFVGGHAAAKTRAWQEADNVIASEPLARKLSLRTGDLISIGTPRGLHKFAVAGIFYDYTSDQGLLLIQRQNFARLWHDDRIHSAALYLKPGCPTGPVIDRIRSSYPGAEAYLIQSNRELRQLVRQIFDQTFQVTNLLRGIALFVAIIGIILNLTAIIKEREREIAILRSIGGSAIQLLFLILTETLLLTIVAVFLGVFGGCALAIVLTDVINVAFFGWTIPVTFPWHDVIPTGILLILTGLAAGLFPAWAAARNSGMRVLMSSA